MKNEGSKRCVNFCFRSVSKVSGSLAVLISLAFVSQRWFCWNKSGVFSSRRLVQQDEHRLPGLNKCRASQHHGGRLYTCRWCRVETLFGVVKNAAWVNGLGREHVVRLGRRVSLFNIFTPAGALKHTAWVTSIPGTPCAPHISSLARPAVSAHLLCVTAGPCAVNSITLFLHRLDYIQECTLHMHKDTGYPTSHGCDLAKSCMYGLNYPN